MTADPGPEVEGYVDKYFKDYQPDDEEIRVEDTDFAAPLNFNFLATPLCASI